MLFGAAPLSSLCDSLFFIAQVSDLSEIVDVGALQLELLLLVDEEAVDSRADSRLSRPDAVFLAGHREATSNFLVVDIETRVQHHELPLGSLLSHDEDALGLALVYHDGLVSVMTWRKHDFAWQSIHLVVELIEKIVEFLLGLLLRLE